MHDIIINMDKIKKYIIGDYIGGKMNFPDFEIVFCTFFKDKKEFIYDNETYEEYVIFCVESGSFYYGFAPDEKCKYTAKSGDIVLCPRGKPFFRKAITPLDFCMIKFVCESELLRNDSPVFLSDTGRFFKNISMLRSSFFRKVGKTDYITNHYCRDIVYQLLSAIQQNETHLSKAFNFINAKYTDEISVSSLADMCGYSDVHFINLFKKHYNYTPKAYISFLRFKKAQHLLKSTDMSVGEISAECGFSDALYFSRFFKAQCGMTPTEFKKATAI